MARASTTREVQRILLVRRGTTTVRSCRASQAWAMGEGTATASCES